jgi:GH25 family lysozyme M1 (1,4-beta-N-acetylmuramidase)
MPLLSASQVRFIGQLCSAYGNATVDIEQYLSAHYFTKGSGRALILQPSAGFGYFYLEPALFAAPESRNAELSDFVGMIVLLNELMLEGRIYYLRKPEDPRNKESVRVLGERFGVPSVHARKVILNQQGDYTDHPRSIKDSAGNAIFHGIRFEGKLFDIANATVRGTVHLTAGVAGLVDPTVAGALGCPGACNGLKCGCVAAPSDTFVPGQACTRSMASANTTENAAEDTARVADTAREPTPPQATIPPAAPTAATARSTCNTGKRGKKIIFGMLGLVLMLAALAAAQFREARLLALEHRDTTRRTDKDIDSVVIQSGASLVLAPARTANDSAAASSRGQKSATVTDVRASPAGETPLAAPATSPDRKLAFGFDISKWNSNLAEKALSTPHVSFVIVRATAGMSKDFDFDVNWTLVKKHSIARGAYHFYKAAEDPVAQARHFLATVGNPNDMTIAPVFDFEELSFDASSAGQKVELVQARLLQALHFVESSTKVTPILYTNVATGNKYLADPRFSRFPLWIADWTNKDAPVLPLAWKAVGFTYWQRSSSYTLAGAGKVPIDLDVYRSPSLLVVPKD